MTRRATALGTGHYLPARIVPNSEFEATLDTTDEWIRSRSGIERRRFAAEDETTSTLALHAARAALANAGLTPDDIDGLIVATSTPDLTFPSVATMVQEGLGMTHGFAFDVQAVCAGFVYALATATAMIVAGMIVGASGSILTNLMAVAMNRSIPAIVFGSFGGDSAAAAGPGGEQGTVKATSAADAAIQMAYANQVIVVPGYGLAVAQAQHAVKEMGDMLESKGVEVKYAIHPVAGRMPGHMNVLLAEADVEYDAMKEMDDINGEFNRTDVTLVIGANDVTNPAARNDPSSPIHGMPILNVDQSKSVIVLKRSMSSGYAGIDNPLFFADQTSMLFGDAKKSVTEVIEELKAL